METNRRDWMRTVGSLALAAGLAGCSGSNDEAGGGQGGGAGTTDTATPTNGPQTETTGEASNSSAAFGWSDDSNATETKGPNPAATDAKGSVATDRLAAGLSFVEHYHYEMNGLQGVGGTLKNESGGEFSSVTVHASVEPGGSGPYTRTLRGSLPAGERARFQFTFGDDAPDAVESYSIWATGTR